ncbi:MULTISPECIES: hypothetical protein [unclassified Methylobacterium]|uniref:hypothetical protein n=1 Tax=unclassified Methylobacterium TaxID=2615210 RepID=UPI00226A8F49|nr:MULTISPECIES: hypothetical protein [unclassified Methylobacterium]
MSLFRRFPARSHIAGEVASSGGRAALDVADLIIARLAADGWAIVPADGATRAFEALAALDAVLDFPVDEVAADIFGQQLGIGDTIALVEACGRARAVLDGVVA